MTEMSYSLDLWGPDIANLGSILSEAIQSKLSLLIEYDNESRVIEPHTLGISTAGYPVLSAYQKMSTNPLGVVSEYSGLDGWRLFRLDKMGSYVFPVHHVFETREGYNPEDSRMVYTFSKV
jgi:hypothetical protein